MEASLCPSLRVPTPCPRALPGVRRGGRWSRVLTAVMLFLGPLLAAGGPGLAQQGQRPAGAEPRAEAPPTLELYAYTLRHQPAADAYDVVRPMLSQRGKISLRSGSDTLEIRDEPETVRQVAAFLRSFDHPTLVLDFEVMVVRASTFAAVSPVPPTSPEIPAALLAEWRRLLRFRHYQLVAKVEIEPRENEQVTYEMGAGYQVTFRTGTLLANRLIKLHDFRLSQTRDGDESVLLHSTLNPRLGRPTTLGLAHDSKSQTALMLVIICRTPRLWEDDEPTSGDDRATDAATERRAGGGRR